MTAVETIVESVRSLSRVEREELFVTLEREALLRQDEKLDRIQAVRTVFGKYAHVPTSVDSFLDRKHQDTQLEER